MRTVDEYGVGLRVLDLWGVDMVSKSESITGTASHCLTLGLLQNCCMFIILSNTFQELSWFFFFLLSCLSNCHFCLKLYNVRESEFIMWLYTVREYPSFTTLTADISWNIDPPFPLGQSFLKDTVQLALMPHHREWETAWHFITNSWHIKCLFC